MMATFYPGQRVRVIGPPWFPEIGIEGVVEGTAEGLLGTDPRTNALKRIGASMYMVHLDHAIQLPVGRHRRMNFHSCFLEPAVDFGETFKTEQEEEEPAYG